GADAERREAARAARAAAPQRAIGHPRPHYFSEFDPAGVTLMYSLTPLPYSEDALEPVIGVETMRTHHGKHHARYVAVTNELAGASGAPLENLIAGARERGDTKLFANAAQAWNHAFYW